MYYYTIFLFWNNWKVNSMLNLVHALKVHKISSWHNFFCVVVVIEYAYQKIFHLNYFLVYSSKVLGMLTLFYNHPQNSFSFPSWNFVPVIATPHFPLLPALASALLSLSMNLSVLATLYKRNHMIFFLLQLPYFNQRNVLKNIHVAAHTCFY